MGKFIFLFQRVHFNLTPDGLLVVLRKTKHSPLVRNLRFINGSRLSLLNSHYWSLIKHNTSGVKK